jgi:NAD-dependent dihydropyrimidine dehydrogenase PreA subunit
MRFFSVFARNSKGGSSSVAASRLPKYGRKPGVLATNSLNRAHPEVKIYAYMGLGIAIIAIDFDLCGQCGGCVPVCPVDAIYLSPTELEVDREICTLCENCVAMCPTGALSIADGE